MVDKTLLNFRNKIDACDTQILQILEERYNIVRQVGAYKNVDEKRESIMRPLREYAMVEDLANRATHIPKDTIRTLYRTVIAGAVSIEENVKISAYDKDCFYLAREYFGAWQDININPSSTQIMNDIQSKKSSIGVVPLDAALDIWQHYESDNMPYIFAKIPLLHKNIDRQYVAISYAQQEIGDNLTYIYLIDDTIIQTDKQQNEGAYLGSFFG